MLKWCVRLFLAVVVSLGFLAGFSTSCEAGQEPITLNKAAFSGGVPARVRVGMGESQAIESPEVKIKSVYLTDSKVADVVVVSPGKINLSGKVQGTTQLVLRGMASNECAVFDVEIFPGISFLKEKLHELLPKENINVSAVGDSVLLAGEVSSAANMALARSLAEQYVAKKEKIVNLLQIGGVQQVMLEVRVAEMSRTLSRRLGINAAYGRGGEFALNTLGNLTGVGGIPPTGGIGGFSDLLASSRLNALLRFTHNSATWSLFIDFLKENELVKILAEPTLVAVSGQEAKFLSGGEIPIPRPEEFNRVTIEYKPYGVGLTFLPTVLSKDKISLKVAPEVSEPDYARMIYYAGWAIPSFTTRRAATTIELGDGQSFAIAGLLRDEVRQLVSKYPILGDIPILGALFRSSDFQSNKTELVIIVTPHLVKPLDIARQTLPTDSYVEPDDFEFYLLAAMEGKEKSGRRPEAKGMEGEFGYIAPLGTGNDQAVKEAPSETGGGETVKETPSETGGGETVKETPSETGGGETVKETPSETGGGETVKETPLETGDDQAKGEK